MPEWERVPLGEVLTQDTAYVDEPEPRMYPKLSVKLYGRGVVLDTPVQGSELKMRRHQLSKPGQVILSEIWGKKGAIGLVPADGGGALCTSHFFLFYIDESRVLPEWLGLIFRANHLEDQLNAGARGTTGYAAVRPKHLLATEIPLPPLHEQQRIVARVKGLLDKVEEARLLRDAATASQKGLWAAIAKEKFAQFDTCASLGDLVTIKGGGTPSKADPSFWGGTIPWVTPKDMKQRVLIDAQIKVTDAALESSPAKLIPAGAVLVVVRGMILAHTVPVAVLQSEATINQDMKALLPQSDLLPDFLSAWMWANNNELVALVEKSTHDTRKFETSKLLGVQIPVPSITDQTATLKELDAALALTGNIASAQAATSDELQDLPSAILAQAFAGAL